MVLIDRNKLIMYIANCRLSESITWEEAEIATDFLLNAPIVESRPKGEWIDREGKETKSKYCGYCSECGGWSEYLTDFCGNCGADMRGKEV